MASLESISITVGKQITVEQLTELSIVMRISRYDHVYRCNTPRPMCQVSSSYSLLSPCHCLRVMLCISCHLVHFICIHVRLMHPSIFPVVRFAFRRFVLLRWSFLAFFRVWGLNISGLDRDLPCGLGLLPVDRLSSFIPFGLCLILQRLTEGP